MKYVLAVLCAFFLAGNLLAAEPAMENPNQVRIVIVPATSLADYCDLIQENSCEIIQVGSFNCSSCSGPLSDMAMVKYTVTKPWANRLAVDEAKKLRWFYLNPSKAGKPTLAPPKPTVKLLPMTPEQEKTLEKMRTA